MVENTCAVNIHFVGEIATRPSARPMRRVAALHRRAAQSHFAIRSGAYAPCKPVQRKKGSPDLFRIRLTLAIAGYCSSLCLAAHRMRGTLNPGQLPFLG